MYKQYLEAGRLVNTHGVRGELVLEPWADSARFLAGLPRLWFDEGKTDAGLLASRVHKDRLLVTLRGVDTVEKAQALRGRVLYLNRDDVELEEGVFFQQDLIGLQTVEEATGRRLGELREVLSLPANDVYRIVDDEGREYYFPAVSHMIGRIDLEAGVIELRPIPGIFDGEDEP